MERGSAIAPDSNWSIELVESLFSSLFSIWLSLYLQAPSLALQLFFTII